MLKILRVQPRESKKLIGTKVLKMHDFRTDLTEIYPDHLRCAYAIPPRSYTGPASPEGYAARLLSRNGTEEIVTKLEQELHVSHEAHGDNLRMLRDHAPEQYDLLIRGDPCAALNHAVAQGDPATAILRPIVSDHALLLCVGTAHLRIAALKQSGTNPLPGFSEQSQWPTMSQVANSALIQPAKKLQVLPGLDVAEDARDEQALQALKNTGILEGDDDSEWLFTMLTQVRDEMPAAGLTTNDVALAFGGAVELTAPLSTATTEDISDAGWAKRSFTLERIGVDTPAGAVIVALNLLLARDRIESCIDAIVANAPLPDFDFLTVPKDLSNNALARITELLRVEGQSDRFAPKVVAPEENRNCKQLVMNTRSKIESGEIDRALNHLRIDPTELFQPKS